MGKAKGDKSFVRLLQAQIKHYETVYSPDILAVNKYSDKESFLVFFF